MVSEKQKGDAAVAEVETPEAFYHYGLLPAQGEVLFPMQEQGKRELTNEKFDAWRLWSAIDTGIEKGLSIFVAKARQWLGISVRGFHFPSVNEYVEMGKESTSRVPYPGGASQLTPERVKAIVKACYRHIIRFPNGFASMNNPNSPSQLIDLDFGKKPENMTDPEWAAYKAHNVVPEQPRFNPKTDKYVAEFVYLTKIDKSVEEADFADYRKNPNKFHYQMVGPMTRKFFSDPPKSVAEVYPQGA